ncbi:hypothetical protein HF329_31755 [Chitinophaga oryzae]|uniref:Uncharacterized protein n=1 Tax=Chitinophaga oryzae TaxID=2725414 RepID=A0AAE6ZMY0_9BACT|nr:hypothetical protein [Chitinophaga oryzae]QJB35632.1 hypothetical protein HF329_31755 [Chitinophaga oryzae]
MFLLISILVLLPIFLILGIISGVVINKTIKSRISKILKAHNYTLISIAHTNKKFKYNKEPKKLNWKDFVTMEGTTAQTTLFKEIVFKTPDNKTVSCLVAIDSFLRVFHKVFFEVDLNSLRETSLNEATS